MGLTNYPFNFHILENYEKKVGPYKLRWQRNYFMELKEFNPDIVIVLGQSGFISNWVIMLWAKLRNKKIIIWACGWDSQKNKSLALLFKNFISKRYFNFADLILLYSTTAKKKFEKMDIKSHMEVCFNGIELDYYDNSMDKIERFAKEIKDEYAENKITFLYVGGILKEKRVDLLVKSYQKIQEARLKDSQLWIIGDGPELNNIKKYVANNNIKDVVFFGRIVDGVDSYFSAADFFVLPGIGGLALNQALYWNNICICADADGTENDLVIPNITGYRFNNGDVNSLYTMMKKAIDEFDTKNQKSMREKGRSLIINRNNVDVMVSHFIQSFRNLCG